MINSPFPYWVLLLAAGERMNWHDRLSEHKKPLAQSAIGYFGHGWMSNSVKNGIIWVGLSVPQGDKGGKVDS